MKATKITLPSPVPIKHQQSILAACSKDRKHNFHSIDPRADPKFLDKWTTERTTDWIPWVTTQHKDTKLTVYVDVSYETYTLFADDKLVGIGRQHVMEDDSDYVFLGEYYGGEGQILVRL